MKKTIILLASLAVLGAVVALFLLRSRVPSYAAAPALERRYSAQLSRLRALALHASSSRTAQEIDADSALFALPEILEVRIETDPNHIRTIGDRTFDWQTRTGAQAVPYSEDGPVVNRYDFQLKDGSRVHAVEFRALAPGPNGHATISILFDLDKLPKD